MTAYTTKTIVATITGTNGDFTAAFDSYNIGNDGEHLKTILDIVLPTAWNVFIATDPASFISVEYRNAKGRCGRSANIAVPASIATHISYEIPRDALYSGETEFWFTVTQPIDATESRITKTAVVRCNVGIGHKAGTVPDPFGHDIIQQLYDEIQDIVDTNANAEVAQAHSSFVKGEVFTTLDARLEEIEQEHITDGLLKVDKVAGKQLSTNDYVKTTVDAQIAAVASGSPAGVYATLVALDTAIPDGDTNIYLVTADGHWYYWNGAAWTSGGVYQATGIAKGTITPIFTNYFKHGKNKFNKDTITPENYINYGNGELVSSASYSASDFIEVDGNTNYCYKALGTIKVAWYDISKTYISGIQTPSNPITSPANAYYVRYSFSIGSEANQQFELGDASTTLEAYIGYYFDVDFFKDANIPLAKIEAVPGAASTYDPDEIIVIMDATSIIFYIKGSSNTSNKYLQYAFKHRTVAFDPTGTIAVSNLDEWRLEEVYEVTRTGEYTFTQNYGESIVNTGEWECALMELGKSDFMGGSSHGDEILTNVHVEFDGVGKTLGTTASFKCKRIKFIQNSQLYRVFTQTPVANHLKVYDITAKIGIRLYQEVEWIVALTLNAGSYLTMLPIKRKLYASPYTQITDKFYRDSDYLVKTVSTEAEVTASGAGVGIGGVKIANIWGDVSGISAQVEIVQSDVPGLNMYLSNSASYNKFYFPILGANYDTSINEVMMMETIFKLDTTL